MSSEQTTKDWLDTQKRCTACGQEKPLEEFYRHETGRYGRENQCKPCARARSAKKRKDNPEKRREIERNWALKNPERRASNLRRWRRENPERARENEKRRIERNPEKHAARVAVRDAVKTGRIVKPDQCEGCGEWIEDGRKLHGHHADYSKPLDVRWLCRKCHHARAFPRGRCRQSCRGAGKGREMSAAKDWLRSNQGAAERLVAGRVAYSLRLREDELRDGSMGSVQTQTPNGIAREILDALADALPETTKGEQPDWMNTSLGTVLRHFESEANAADELIRNTDAAAMCDRYEIPWGRRYEIERDTYRYVLKQIADARPVETTKGTEQ